MGDATIESYGLVKNPFKLLDPLYGENRGRDSYIMQIEDAKGGDVAAVVGPNQEIMSSKWSLMNDYIGLHQASIRYFTNSTVEYGVIIEYWTKDENGTETLAKTQDIPITCGISDKFGSGAGFSYFGENKQVKFVIKSHPATPLSCWVGVDWLQLDIISKFNAISRFIYSTDGYAPAVLQIDIVNVIITGDLTSHKYSTVYTLDYTPISFYAKPLLTSSDGETLIAPTNYNNNSFTLTAVDIDHVNWSGKLDIPVEISAWVPVDYI